MGEFKGDGEKAASAIEKILKLVGRFTVVYVLAFVFCALVSFSYSYKYLCAIAPLIVAVLDFVLWQRKSNHSADSTPPSDISQEILTIQNEILEIRKFNEEFRRLKPSMDSEFSFSRQSVIQMQKDIAANKRAIEKNTECLKQLFVVSNDINDIHCKISNLSSLSSSIDVLFHNFNNISQKLSALTELKDLASNNENNISVLSQLFNSLSSEIESLKVELYNLNSQKKTSNPPAMERIDLLEGWDFEYFCADLLKESGYKNVTVTKGSGDQGVDILAEKDGIRYAVQCKRYSSELSNKPVQEVHAGKDMYKCQIGVVMTNSYFTPGAKDLAQATGVLLWDRDILQQMLCDITTIKE